MIDNSGFSGMVTLNSLGRVLPRWFSLFVNKSPVSNLFFAAFSYLVICLCYHAIACESLDLCETLSACLDPNFKNYGWIAFILTYLSVRLDCFYSNLSKCGTRVNEAQ